LKDFGKRAEFPAVSLTVDFLKKFPEVVTHIPAARLPYRLAGRYRGPRFVLPDQKQMRETLPEYREGVFGKAATGKGNFQKAVFRFREGRVPVF
jgi:hypothetical protein